MQLTADSGHPGNDYYVEPLTGTIQRQADPVAAEAMKLAGWQGPFTWAQAKAFISHDKKTPVSGIGSALSGINEIAAVVKAAFTTVTDWHFWASLGWIILGLILLVLGIRLWLGKSTVPSPAVV